MVLCNASGKDFCFPGYHLCITFKCLVHPLNLGKATIMAAINTLRPHSSIVYGVETSSKINHSINASIKSSSVNFE